MAPSNACKLRAEPNRISDFNEDSFMIDTEAHLRELFLPFRCFCTRKEVSLPKPVFQHTSQPNVSLHFKNLNFRSIKQIKSEEVVLEDTDVVKGLVEFITRSVVEVLIIGTPSKGGFLKYVRSFLKLASFIFLYKNFLLHLRLELIQKLSIIVQEIQNKRYTGNYTKRGTGVLHSLCHF